MKNKVLIVTAIVFAATMASLTKMALADNTSNILPTADGTYLEWNPSEPPTPPATSTLHYTMVDESICNGTTDYNYTNSAGARDSYLVDISSIPNNATINSISITPCASANLLTTSTPISSTMAVFYRYNGSNSTDANNYSLPGNSNVPSQLATTNFNGLSLIKNQNSNLEVGIKLTLGSAGARLSQLITSVSYTLTTTPTGTPPIVTTTPAIRINKSRVTLNGSANPNGLATIGWFRYSTISPGTCNDTFGTRVPAVGGINLGSGNSFTPFSFSGSGFYIGTTYYYCAIGSNGAGLGFGTLKSF